MNDKKKNISHGYRHSEEAIKKIVASWDHRAQVKKDPIDNSIFDVEKPDFLPELLPFKNHPDYLAMPEEIKFQILTIGWLIYNEKTIAIESRVILPCCRDILENDFPGANRNLLRTVISQTLTDEGYHILLVENASAVTRQQRQLKRFVPAEFTLPRNLQQEKDLYAETWQKKLLELITAIVSETFISDYLSLLSTAHTIQPFNRLVVEAHWKDENVHSNIFAFLTKYIYHKLSNKEKKFFAHYMAKPVRWFAEYELSVWSSALDQMNIPYKKEMLKDCEQLQHDSINRVDYTEVLALAEDCDILNTPEGRASFEEEGLLK